MLSLWKVGVWACSDTRFEWHKVVNYPATLPTTKTILTTGAQDNLGHMQMNKQGTLSCKNVLSLHERHQSGCNRGSVAFQQVTRMFSSKNPDDSLEAYVCSPYIPPTLCISITFVTSLNDVMIVCFPLLVGKPCACTEELCQLACTPTGIPTEWI